MYLSRTWSKVDHRWGTSGDRQKNIYFDASLSSFLNRAASNRVGFSAFELTIYMRIEDASKSIVVLEPGRG